MPDALLSPKDVDDFIIVRAVTFANAIQRIMMRDVLKDEDLPLLEWRLLFCLARFGDCHMASIIEKTSFDPAHCSRAASALEAKGLIERSVDPDDNRRRVMRLTPSGQATFERIWPNARDLVKSVKNGLSEEDFEKFKALLDQANAIAGPILHRANKLGEDRPAA